MAAGRAKYPKTSQVGGRRISFGGTFELRERFPGARAGRAADYLGDPRRVLSAAWPARLIDGPVARDDGVLDYELRQETINFAGLLKVDARAATELRGAFDMHVLCHHCGAGFEVDLTEGWFPLRSTRSWTSRSGKTTAAR